MKLLSSDITFLSRALFQAVIHTRFKEPLKEEALISLLQGQSSLIEPLEIYYSELCKAHANSQKKASVIAKLAEAGFPKRSAKLWLDIIAGVEIPVTTTMEILDFGNLQVGRSKRLDFEVKAFPFEIECVEPTISIQKREVDEYEERIFVTWTPQEVGERQSAVLLKTILGETKTILLKRKARKRRYDRLYWIAGIVLAVVLLLTWGQHNFGKLASMFQYKES